MGKDGFTLSEIKGAKITNILFSQKPERSVAHQTDFEKALGINHALDLSETDYEVDSGAVCLILDNGIVLKFWNSEWGGMTIYPKTEFEHEQKFDECREYSDE